VRTSEESWFVLRHFNRTGYSIIFLLILTPLHQCFNSHSVVRGLKSFLRTPVEGMPGVVVKVEDGRPPKNAQASVIFCVFDPTDDELLKAGAFGGTL